VADQRCITCDYLLRGLDPGGRCPECGTPIVRSLTGPWLRRGNLAQLNRLYLCLRLVNLATIAAAIAVPLSMMMWLVTAVNATLGPAGVTNEALFWKGAVVLLIMGWTVAAALGFTIANHEQRRLDASLPGERELRSILLPLTSILCAAGLMYFFWIIITLGSRSAPLWLLHAFALVTWVQSIALCRWLDAIESRIHPLSLHPIFESWLVSLLREVKRVLIWRGASLWSHDSWRTTVAYIWVPMLVGFYWWQLMTRGVDLGWTLALAAVAPWMLMLTKGRLVRALRRERNAALEEAAHLQRDGAHPTAT
jgi:hypothetical protein